MLIGIGALVIPGLGPVVVGGVLATTFGVAGGTAVAGAGIGAAAGGLPGALAGLGMPESEERYFETGFKAGQVLVTVEAGARVLEAMAIFDRYGADTGPATRPGAIGGFCSLMISHHRGIFSIGLLLTCGVGSVLLAALTVLPSLLALLATNGPARSPAYAERDGLFPRAEPIRLAGLSYRASLTADRLPPIRRLDPRPVLGAGTALAADGGTPQRPS